MLTIEAMQLLMKYIPTGFNEIMRPVMEATESNLRFQSSQAAVEAVRRTLKKNHD